MDIEACLKRIEEHLNDGDLAEAKLAIADADTWIDKGGSVTPDQHRKLRQLKTQLYKQQIANTKSTD